MHEKNYLTYKNELFNPLSKRIMDAGYIPESDEFSYYDKKNHKVIKGINRSLSMSSYALIIG